MTECPHKILVFTDGEIIGDGFIKLPFMKALRAAYPESKIYWHTRGPSVYATSLKPIADAFLDGVLVQTPLIKLWRYKFDLVIDTQKVFLRSLRLKLLRHRQMASSSARYIFSNFKPPRDNPLPRHDLKRLINLVSLAGRPLKLTKQGLPLSQEFKERAEQILPPHSSYIGLIVGAGKPFKCWPLESFIALAKILTQQGFVPAFILGPQEEAWLNRIKEQVPNALFPLQHALAINSSLFTVAIGERFLAAISNDCGGGHMMSAAEIPLISLFGKTNPDKVSPLVETGIIIRSHTYGSDEMRDIPVEAVVEAFDDLQLS